MSNTFRLSRMVLAGLIAIVMSYGAPWSEAGWDCFFVVIHSSGPRNGLVFQPADLPQTLTIELRMGNSWFWTITNYWIDIDCASFTNGLGADLRLAEVSCSENADCEAAFGTPGSACINNQCEAIFPDILRPDFIFASPCQSAGGFSDSSCDPSVGFGDSSECTIQGSSYRYEGTVVLEIPAEAVGTYDIALSPASTMTLLWSGQSQTYSLHEFAETWGGTGVIEPVHIKIQARIPPVPVADADPQAAPAARTAGVEFVPQTAFVDPFAVQVTLDSLHHPDPPYSGGPVADFSAFEGQQRWLGPPVQQVEASGDPTTFWAATLQCTPYYMDWTTVGAIHIVGSEVVPSSTLNVSTFGSNCVNREATCTNISGPLELATARWADVAAPFGAPGGPAEPDFDDVSALVGKFKNQPGALSKTRTKLQPAIPDMGSDVDFSDITMCVDAFKGMPYPFTMQSCP